MKTMTPKEKADELIDKMYYVGMYDDKEDYNPAMAWERAKQCALMAVEEAKIEIGNYDRTDGYVRTREDFWDAVKSELQSL
jgi:hypothetical protein